MTTCGDEASKDATIAAVDIYDLWFVPSNVRDGYVSRIPEVAVESTQAVNQDEHSASPNSPGSDQSNVENNEYNKLSRSPKIIELLELGNGENVYLPHNPDEAWNDCFVRAQPELVQTALHNDWDNKAYNNSEVDQFSVYSLGSDEFLRSPETVRQNYSVFTSDPQIKESIVENGQCIESDSEVDLIDFHTNEDHNLWYWWEMVTKDCHTKNTESVDQLIVSNKDEDNSVHHPEIYKWNDRDATASLCNFGDQQIAGKDCCDSMTESDRLIVEDKETDLPNDSSDWVLLDCTKIVVPVVENENWDNFPCTHERLSTDISDGRQASNPEAKSSSLIENDDWDNFPCSPEKDRQPLNHLNFFAAQKDPKKAAASRVVYSFHSGMIFDNKVEIVYDLEENSESDTSEANKFTERDSNFNIYQEFWFDSHKPVEQGLEFNQWKKGFEFSLDQGKSERIKKTDNQRFNDWNMRDKYEKFHLRMTVLDESNELFKKMEQENPRLASLHSKTLPKSDNAEN